MDINFINHFFPNLSGLNDQLTKTILLKPQIQPKYADRPLSKQTISLKFIQNVF